MKRSHRKKRERHQHLVLHPDGRLAIAGFGLGFSDLYHQLIAMSWPRFFGVYGGVFLVVNLIFASVYSSLPTDSFDGFGDVHGGRFFLRCFFFSVQTLGTIGYGKYAPVSVAANLVVTLETMTGITGTALVTGLIFGRFARPRARVLFSAVAVIKRQDGVPSLVFRVVNQRSSQIVEARAHVVLVWNDTTKEGEPFRRMYDLRLRRDTSPLFGLSWTVIHPIDEESPLFGKTREQIESSAFGIIITFSGTEETLSAPIYTRHTYHASDLRWDQKFVDITQRLPDGRTHLDMARFHHVEPTVGQHRL